ncbi:hypothetical protein chiPu_0007117 [Chiloscyllium punctatum]|uniref:Uncharacterized protein n=1 Tax=Chiloscyllium punctatum TaxID=137246 RepID=A0A401SE60_CHIPU|nr:hypothetical protein [Chiloscyllium punctatum]
MESGESVKKISRWIKQQQIKASNKCENLSWFLPILGLRYTRGSLQLLSDSCARFVFPLFAPGLTTE